VSKAVILGRSKIDQPRPCEQEAPER